MTQPTPYGQQPYPAYPYLPARSDNNGFGVAGLVLGILALVFSFIPFVGLISWVLAPLGVVFGGLGVAKSNRGEASNRGVALGGVITASIAFGVCVLWLLWTIGLAAAT